MKIRQAVTKFFLGNSVPLLSGVWNWVLPGEWTKGALISQYKNYIYPIVSAIAEESAKIELTVMRETATDKIAIKNHDFLDLMKKPNPMMSQFQFLELHFTFMKLCGESYWYIASGTKTGKPREIYLLRPDRMTVVVDKDDPRGLVGGYILDRGDGNLTTFEAEEIIHHKMPNPKDPYYGYSTIMAAQTYVQTENYGSKWTKNSIFNSGRPSGIVNIKGTGSADQFNALKRRFNDEYSGTENAGKTLLLRGMDGIDFQKLGMELDGVAMKELKDMSRDDLMMMFRVSKTMLGISEGVSVANARENRAMFFESIVKPEADRLIDVINAFLIGRYGAGLNVEYKDPAMKSDTEKLENWKAGHNKWLTTNDIRKEQGLKPLKGGDVIREPVALIETSSSTESDKKALSVKKKANLNQIEAFRKQLFNNQERWEVKYLQFMRQEFKTQKEEILKANKKESFVEWHFDVAESKSRISTTLMAYGVDLMQEAAKLGFDLAGDNESQLRIDEKILAYIHDRIDRLATETNDETIRQIEQTIAEGVSTGESMLSLRKRIEDVYDYADSVRAERIARTETLAALNRGTNEAYRQSPMVKAKEWSTEANGCQFCLAMNGRIIGIDDDFAKLGETMDGNAGGKLSFGYENIVHPPLHPNCRCSIIPVSI